MNSKATYLLLSEMVRVYFWKPYEVKLPQARHLAGEIGARIVNSVESTNNWKMHVE